MNKFNYDRFYGKGLYNDEMNVVYEYVIFCFY